MSIPNKTSVNCPHCGTSFATTVWSSVNTDLSNDLAERIINGEFFDAKCPKCGFVSHMEYDMLYHDMKHNAMIWVVHAQDPGSRKKLEDIKKSPILPGCLTRVVHDMNELREKAAALESGKDDRIVELCKVSITYEVARQNPKFKPHNVFYTYAGGEDIMFIYNSSGKELSCKLESDIYNSIKAIFSNALMDEKAKPYAVYDDKWADAFFSANYHETSNKSPRFNLDINVEQELGELKIAIKECETKLEEIRQLGLRDDTIEKKAAMSGVDAAQYKKCLRKKIIDLQRKYNSLIDDNHLTASKEKYIIDTYDDFRFDDNYRNKYKLLDKIDIDIDKRIRDSSLLNRCSKVDENENDIIYCYDHDFLRKDKRTGEFVYFGSGSETATIYNDWVYWYEWGSILSDKFIMRRKLDASSEEKLEWLSNKKTGEAIGHSYHIVSEDKVQKMYTENGMLIIIVKRISKGGGVYKIIATEEGTSLKLRKEIMEGEMRDLLTQDDSSTLSSDKNPNVPINAGKDVPAKTAYTAFTKNPFYILNVTCSDNRRAIIVASDEMSFLHDAELCSEASGILTTPAKRLAAEINWFIDLDSDLLSEIRSCIEQKQIISTDKMISLSKLNATLYNFSLSDESDYFEIGYSILDIDEQYSEIDLVLLAEAINQCREKAKMPLVSEQDVSIEYSKKRESIRQVINERLASLDEDSYIELVTMLAEKCIADDDYDDGVILSDVIDQYEIRMQAKIEDNTSQIKAHIERIKNLANDDAITSNIKPLIGRVKQWDKLVQPLQLKSRASGMPHEISESVGRELRALALYLHNEKCKTEDALTLVNAMREIFAEIGDLIDYFDADSEVLEDLLAGDKAAKEVLAEMDALNRTADSLKLSATSTTVDNFVSRVRSLDERINTLDIEEELRVKIRESLCYMVREAAIELHNNKQQTSFALSIAKALLNQFGDVPSLKTKLSEDVNTLNQQLIYQNVAQTRKVQQKAAQKSKNIGCLVVIGIIVLIVIISAIANNVGSSSSSSPSSSNYSSGNTASSETAFSSNSTSGSRVYANIVSIWPAIGIYTEGSTNYTSFVCECKTSSGSTMWVYMTVTEYKNNFDSSASTSIYSSYADEVTYSSSVKIHGTVKKADTIMSGLSSDTDTVVVDFSSLDD